MGKSVAEAIKEIVNEQELLDQSSDRLRANVETLLGFFGDPDKCICGRFINSHHKPSEGCCQVLVEKHVVDHTATPRIRASIRIRDEQPFHTAKPSDEGLDASLYRYSEYGLYLATVPKTHEVGVEKWEMQGAEPRLIIGVIAIADLKLEHVKALVESGRIPVFLEHLSDELAKVSIQYKQGAQVVEELAKANIE